MKEQILPTFWLIGLSVVMGVAGQLAIKLGLNNYESTGFVASGPVGLLAMIFRTPLVLLGLLMYGVGAMAWIVVLSRVDLSYAYPFLSLNFVLIAIVSRVVLSETIPAVRWLGIFMICLGTILIGRSGT